MVTWSHVFFLCSLDKIVVPPPHTHLLEAHAENTTCLFLSQQTLHLVWRMYSPTKLHFPGPLQTGSGNILIFSVWYKELLGCGFLKAGADTVLKIGMHFKNFVLLLLPI